MEEDPDDKALAQKEIEDLFADIEDQAETIVETILPENNTDKRNVTMEIM